MTSYDRVPYRSDPFPHSQPDRLKVIANIFGLDAPQVHTARVIELGCAAGNNIIPLAFNFPQSTFVGVDLSHVQIEAGMKTIAELGLKNIELITRDFRDLTTDGGKFDYLICHGTMSWVNADIRRRIFELCRDLLSENGIAYISYNCFPGWHLRILLREMMLYHLTGIEDESTLITEAKRFAGFLSRSFTSDDKDEERLLRNAAAAIAELPDWYLFHDLLEDENHPLYFHQFLKLCREHQLTYVADGEIESMLPQEFSGDVVRELKAIARPELEREQYLDFLRVRTFRRGIVCRRSTAPRSTNPEALRSMFVSSSARFKHHNGENWRFETAEGSSIETSNPDLAAIFERLVEIFPAFLPFDQLVFDKRDADLSAALLKCFFSGIVELRTTDLPIGTVSTHPCAYPLARYQALHGDTVTSLKHGVIHLEQDVIDLLGLLDGTKSIAEITAEYSAIMAKNGTALPPEQEISLHVQGTLEKLARAALLLSPQIGRRSETQNE